MSAKVDRNDITAKYICSFNVASVRDYPPALVV